MNNYEAQQVAKDCIEISKSFRLLTPEIRATLAKAAEIIQHHYPSTLWTTQHDGDIDVREMTDLHLANARNAVAKGSVNPHKDHECWVPKGETQCPGCLNFNEFRAKWLAIFDKELERRESPFKVGQMVRTVAVDNPSTDWVNPKDRCFDVVGQIISESRGHGLCYEVYHRHPQSGWYEPRELVAL